MQDSLKEKFDASECEIWDVELQWNNNRKGVLDARITSDLLVKVERGWGGTEVLDCTVSAQ